MNSFIILLIFITLWTSKHIFSHHYISSGNYLECKVKHKQLSVKLSEICNLSISPKSVCSTLNNEQSEPSLLGKIQLLWHIPEYLIGMWLIFRSSTTKLNSLLLILGISECLFLVNVVATLSKMNIIMEMISTFVVATPSITLYMMLIILAKDPNYATQK